MIYRILADLVVAIHFFWIVFVVVGFVITFYYLLPGKNKAFFDRWILRTIHFLGISYVTYLSVIGKYCPFTVLENSLRMKYNPDLVYPGSCIVHYLQKLVYPDLNPLIVNLAIIIIAAFSIAVYLVKPPAKIKNFFKWTN